jgi:hypothetical protein
VARKTHPRKYSTAAYDDSLRGLVASSQQQFGFDELPEWAQMLCCTLADERPKDGKEVAVILIQHIRMSLAEKPEHRAVVASSQVATGVYRGQGSGKRINGKSLER